jgi:S-adenosylmethionine-diacylgycerolhomoserine-N-methlytransferase
MPPSTSPASPRPPEDRLRDASGFEIEALDRFYGFQARIYDWTRPLLLFGRRAAARALSPRPGQKVLDVGCGTGWNLARLAAGGGTVVGIEPSAPMRRLSARRLERLGLAQAVVLDARPYGVHADYEASADGVLFSYSLSMIPPFERVLERARRDLRPGGRIVVVDFLEARGPVALALRRSHVRLGHDRLDRLRELFPSHRLDLRSLGAWSYFLFHGVLPGVASIQSITEPDGPWTDAADLA